MNFEQMENSQENLLNVYETYYSNFRKIVIMLRTILDPLDQGVNQIPSSVEFS